MIVLYVDPNVPYISTKHIFLMVFAMVVTLLLLPPLLILMVYPTSLYRKISDSISPMWRIRIITNVELFHSSVKDRTNGTRDYRFLSTHCVRIFTPVGAKCWSDSKWRFHHCFVHVKCSLWFPSLPVHSVTAIQKGK